MYASIIVFLYTCCIYFHVYFMSLSSLGYLITRKSNLTVVHMVGINKYFVLRVSSLCMKLMVSYVVKKWFKRVPYFPNTVSKYCVQNKT